jgi:transposase
LWEVAPWRGRKATYGPEKIQSIVDATLRSKPKGMTQWSCRLLAASQGVSKSTINNIWQSHNLKPHRVKSFKLSRDAKFLEKLTDVVGLYLNPPQQAMVLCVDEKSQIQALDRTQPGLPLKKGRCGTMTHDYKRNGTTSLFAALEVLQGKVIGECYERHRHQEFLKFLRRLDQEFPGEIRLHLVMDNYGTHKHPRVQAWMKRHPRFITHFVPTSSSWLNLVERWFGELTSKRIRRGSFGSVEDLEKAIEEFLTAWNQKPKPFVWTATVDAIVDKLSRCRQTLEKIQPGCTLPRTRRAKRRVVQLFFGHYTRRDVWKHKILWVCCGKYLPVSITISGGHVNSQSVPFYGGPLSHRIGHPWATVSQLSHSPTWAYGVRLCS